MSLPRRRTDWPVWAWEMWEERAAHREAAGETVAEAARNAEEDVRRWRALDGEAFLAQQAARGAAISSRPASRTP